MCDGTAQSVHLPGDGTSSAAGSEAARSKTRQTLPTPVTEGRVAGEPAATSTSPVRPGTVAHEGEGEGESGDVAQEEGGGGAGGGV